KNIHPDGIISSKSNLIKLAKDMGAFTILKLVIYDSHSLEDGIKTIKRIRPHVVEVMPGIIPSVINQVYDETKASIIASGLINEKYYIDKNLNSGCIAVVTSN